MKKFVLICLMLFVLSGLCVARVNTIPSSTMVFAGTIIDNGDGTWGGTFAMIDETGTGYGNGEAGFDVYAKNGAWATWKNGTYNEFQVADHDAYTTYGGWGTQYDPDCSDWQNYQLKITGSSWAVEYNANVGNDGILTGATAAPMSGTINWASMIATETGTGAYYSGSGALDPGKAANFAASKGQSTAGAWDMDWSWGSDYVPLEYAGFKLAKVGYDQTTGYHILTLTPNVPVPGAVLLGGIGVGLVGWMRRRKTL